MGCDSDDISEDIVVERDIELDAPPEVVWGELPALFEDDDDRVRVVELEDAPSRLSFWWAPADEGVPPSHVAIDVEPSAVGTVVHIRETRLDGAQLVRSAFSALARA